MAVRPSKPNLTTIPVQTIDPKTIGQPVVQQTATVSSTEETTVPSGTSTHIPKRAYAEWSLADLYSRADASAMTARVIDALVMYLFAYQAAKDTTDTLAIIDTIVPGATVITKDSGGTYAVRWDEWTIGDKQILAFPLDLNPYTFYTTYDFGTSKITEYSDPWLFSNGFVGALRELKVPLASNYIPATGDPARSIITTGYALGGMYAAWAAFELNRAATGTEESQKPAIAAYSFGAPAGWVDPNNTESFHAFHRHFRYATAGDVNPAIVAGKMEASALSSLGFSALLAVPLHYADYSSIIGQPRGSLSRQSSLYSEFANIIDTTPTLLVDASLTPYADARSRSAYADALMAECLYQRDTPITIYDALDSWYQKLLTAADR